MTKDILFESGELLIRDGDLVVAESDQQHIEHILLADQGQFRESPLVGFGIKKYLNGSVNKTDMKQGIRVQLRSDNFNVKTLDISNDFSIKIDAKRNEAT